MEEAVKLSKNDSMRSLDKPPESAGFYWAAYKQAHVGETPYKWEPVELAVTHTALVTKIAVRSRRGDTPGAPYSWPNSYWWGDRIPLWGPAGR